MRLTCPNCGAQYEVPDGVIPAAGRDVQCSNCGHTWFQTPPEAGGPAPRPDAGAQTPPAEESAPTPAPDAPPADAPPRSAPSSTADARPQAPAPPAPEAGAPAATPEDSQPHAAAAPRSAAEDTSAPADAADPDDDAGHAPPPRRRLDPEVADILRSEAEREQRARSADAQPLETQPDLGLDGAAMPDPEAAQATGERASRRDRLPDIEDIKSNLRGETEPPEEEAPAPPPGAGGNFARGVALALLLGSLLIALYAYAGALAEEVPALAPALAAYVAAVEAGRVWAHDTVTAVLLWLERLGAA